MKRAECLKQAEKIVTASREETYGPPEDNFSLIAKLWSNYLSTGCDTVDVSAGDVAMMMSLLKIARIRTGNHKDDNYVDLAGYAACGCEIGSNKMSRNDINDNITEHIEGGIVIYD